MTLKPLSSVTPSPGDTITASFAAGCFWNVEATFAPLPGVKKTTVGYTGGHSPAPTYQQICAGNTGHAETLQLEFDPAQISYMTLLDTFWASHDPTTLNRQGLDRGEQYRSIIFYHDAQQQRLAEASRVATQKTLKKLIVTAIVPATIFYPAENYHQRYFEKNTISCHKP